MQAIYEAEESALAARRATLMGLAEGALRDTFSKKVAEEERMLDAMMLELHGVRKKIATFRQTITEVISVSSHLVVFGNISLTLWCSCVAGAAQVGRLEQKGRGGRH